MSDLPPGLRDFGERLRRAAEDEVRAGDRARRRRRRLRGLALPVAATLAAAAVGAGAVKLADGGAGAPIAPERSSAGSAQQAARDPAVVEASATADPDGGPPWVVRLFANAAGRECVQVGRLRAGEFGRVQRGRFRALPASAPATCAARGARGPLIVAERHGIAERTVVFGVGVDRAAVDVRFGDRRRRVRPVGFGAFVAVFEGVDVDAAVVVHAKAGGRGVVRRL